MIGIVGGIGPMAGLNLAARVVHFTSAVKDQDHLPMILWTDPSKVGDRTEFLLGKISVNPGYALAKQIIALEKAGASVVGMACNTVHAPSIVEIIFNELLCNQSTIRFVHVIQETVEEMKKTMPAGTRIGILGTSGTYLTGLYRDPLTGEGFEVVDPGREFQDSCIHRAIYDPDFGIKSTGTEVRQEAIDFLQKAVQFYQSHQVGAMVLACSEVNLAMQNVHSEGIRIIRPMDILAKALIREYLKTEIPKKE